MDKIINIPNHIAIIMDGNGRWAAKRHLPRPSGHRRGVEVVKAVVKTCAEIGVKYLTLYTFSMENWRRPKQEINFLMKLLNNYLAREIRNLKSNNIKLLTIGDINKLPHSVQRVIEQAKDQTKTNDGLKLILAINYGGRQEIIRAVLSLCAEVRRGKLSPTDVNEELFSNYLFTADIPDPDLLIRTSGEMRLSNFLLWQLSYSELYITDKLWPDFKNQDLIQAITEFQKRKRRYGGL